MKKQSFEEAFFADGKIAIHLEPPEKGMTDLSLLYPINKKNKVMENDQM